MTMKTNKRKTDNNIFANNEKKFYSNLEENKKNNLTKHQLRYPTQEKIENFWKNIWSYPVQHNDKTDWIETEKDTHRNIKTEEEIIITEEEFITAIRKTHNWKTPGADHIQNFWYKNMTSVHNQLIKSINQVIHNPQTLPYFLTSGKTYIKPKSEETENPANYRPITCLPTLYKIITSIITNIIDKHTSINNIIAEEQKGCRKKRQRVQRTNNYRFSSTTTSRKTTKKFIYMLYRLPKGVRFCAAQLAPENIRDL